MAPLTSMLFMAAVLLSRERSGLPPNGSGINALAAETDASPVACNSRSTLEL